MSGNFFATSGFENQFLQTARRCKLSNKSVKKNTFVGTSRVNIAVLAFTPNF